MIGDFKGRSFSDCLDLIRAKGMTWIAKRLTGNDTGLTGGHQAGVYIPKKFFDEVIPEVATRIEFNPRIPISCLFPQVDASVLQLAVIYYNSKFFPERGLKKKYDEIRVTGWGGKSSPVQSADNTGSVFIFATARTPNGMEAVALVAETESEDALIEEWLGREVEPGLFLYSWDESPSLLQKQAFPLEWLVNFPSGVEIFDFVKNGNPRSAWRKSIDELLLRRRDEEFKVFSEVERAHILPRIRAGFLDVETFMGIALSVANRRKSRTGTSLELNLSSIFDDEKVSYSAQGVTEGRKKPDFLFPGSLAYHSAGFPHDRLTMLAAKTCCKDRWRQALSEADKIEKKHLFTLQEGVSENQLQEMASKHLTLVVPEPNLRSFPVEWREKILTLSSFVDLVRSRQ